jgi:2-polyprenyl-3-methyl-5-hydroxy-6-metoxy-1,4-benzoquinol methylase
LKAIDNRSTLVNPQFSTAGRHMFDQKEASSIVTLLYQTVLGRDPDPKGLQQYVSGLVSGHQTVAQIIQEFAASPEYAHRTRLLDFNLMQFRKFPDADVFVPPQVVDQLFDKTSFYWRNAASEPNEMYWSVVTEEKWNRELTSDDRIEFIATGKRYANRVLALYETYSGKSAANLSCIDFGCGVGRLAINFASRVAQVHAVDFSESHLQELQRNAATFDCASKITPWPIRLPADLDQLPQVDLVYSYIALQHNTPPVIATMMRSLLDHLQPGGYAFLHVPLAGAGYEGFVVNDYLTSIEAGTRMEIHILPRANINSLAAKAGCEIVTSHCVGGTHTQYSEEIVFHKPMKGV